MIRVNRGAALVVVLVVMVVLALGAYGFLFVMRSEYETSGYELDNEQARAAAHSGTEAVLAWMQLSSAERQAIATQTGSGDQRTAPFRAIELDADLAEERGISQSEPMEASWSFSVIASLPQSSSAPDPMASVSLGTESSSPPIAFGVDDESSKLDVRLLLRWEQEQPGHARRVLEELWGLSPSDVNRILQSLGIESPALNSSSPSLGSSSSTNASTFNLSQPDSPISEAAGANGLETQTPKTSNDVSQNSGELERRLRRGLGEGRWWGDDWNRNGRSEVWEQGKLSPPPVSPLEASSLGGQTGSLPTQGALLLDSMATNRGAGFGSANESLGAEAWQSPASGPLRNWLTCWSAERNETFGGEPRVWINDPDANRLRDQLSVNWPEEWVSFVLAYRRFGPAPDADATSAVPATDPSVATWQMGSADEFTHEIRDPLELVDALVALPADELDGQAMVVASPFVSSGPELARIAQALLDEISISDAPVLDARISLSSAPELVLLAIPGWDEQAVQQIIEARTRVGGDSQSRQTIGWIWSEGLVDLTTMKAVHSYLTIEGDVAAGQVVGFRDDLSPVYRLTTLFDATRQPARLINLSTWHTWGRGFTASELRGETSPSDPSLLGNAP